MAKSKKKTRRKRVFSKKNIAKFFKSLKERREKEYSKRLLNRIITHSILMLWATYGLAYLGREEIAETLSKTIVTSIIAIVVGYLVKSVFENISKYTTAFGDNILPEIPEPDDEIEPDPEYTQDDDETNMNRDC
ncbi:MAG: hypothetical protein PHR82_06715 [Endomicrobiaceae bacterium]|nr:hypothetical protein [Endomicrobiaceae bacterium]